MKMLSQHPEAIRRRRERRENFRRGVCTDCGINKPVPGRKQCSMCNEQWRKTSGNAKKELQKYRRDRGLCTNCGIKTNGTRYCQHCQQVAAEAKRKLRRKRESEYECIKCGKPLDKDGKICMSCCDEQNATRWLKAQEREENHQCKTCGVQLAEEETFKNCEKCRRINNAKSKRIKENRRRRKGIKPRHKRDSDKKVAA